MKEVEEQQAVATLGQLKDFLKSIPEGLNHLLIEFFINGEFRKAELDLTVFCLEQGFRVDVEEIL